MGISSLIIKEQMGRRRSVLALSCALATITGCTSSKSSPERHAYAFVAHRSDVAFAHASGFILLAAGVHRREGRQV
jgi:6-phosphofructokinase